MLKKIIFAVAPMMLVAGSVMADEDLLSSIAKMDLDHKVTSTDVAETDNLGQADVDALLGEDDESPEKAIAACFRRIGYRSYRSYNNYSNHGSFGYNNYHTPVYHRNYRYTPTYSYYTPTYSCYTPVYSSYWGCW